MANMQGMPKTLVHALKGGRLTNPRNNPDGSMSFSRPGGGKRVTYSAYELGRTPVGGQRQVGYLPNRQAPGQLGQVLRGEGVPGGGRHPMALDMVRNAINIGGPQPGMAGVPWATEVDARRFGGLQTSTPIEGIASGIPHALGIGAPSGWRNAPSQAQIMQRALSMPPGPVGSQGGIGEGFERGNYPYHGNEMGFWETTKNAIETMMMGNPFTSPTRHTGGPQRGPMMSADTYYDTLGDQSLGASQERSLGDYARGAAGWLRDALGFDGGEVLPITTTSYEPEPDER